MRIDVAHLESPGQEHFGGRVWRALADGCSSGAAQLERWDQMKEGLRPFGVLWALLCLLGRRGMAGSHHSLGGSG